MFGLQKSVTKKLDKKGEIIQLENINKRINIISIYKLHQQDLYISSGDIKNSKSMWDKYMWFYNINYIIWWNQSSSIFITE